MSDWADSRSHRSPYVRAIAVCIEAALGIGSPCQVGIAAADTEAGTGIGIEAEAEAGLGAALQAAAMDTKDIHKSGIAVADTGRAADRTDLAGSEAATDLGASGTADLADTQVGAEADFAGLGIADRTGAETGLGMSDAGIVGPRPAPDTAGIPVAAAADTAGLGSDPDIAACMAASGTPEAADSDVGVDTAAGSAKAVSAAGAANSTPDRPIPADSAKAATNRILRASPMVKSLLQDGCHRSYCATHLLGLPTDPPIPPHYMNRDLEGS